MKNFYKKINQKLFKHKYIKNRHFKVFTIIFLFFLYTVYFMITKKFLFKIT